MPIVFLPCDVFFCEFCCGLSTLVASCGWVVGCAASSCKGSASAFQPWLALWSISDVRSPMRSRIPAGRWRKPPLGTRANCRRGTSSTTSSFLLLLVRHLLLLAWHLFLVAMHLLLLVRHLLLLAWHLFLVAMHLLLLVRHLLLLAWHLFLVANLVTTSKALVTTSVALVSSSEPCYY